MAEFTVVDLDLTWEVELGQGGWPSLRCCPKGWIWALP